MKRLIAIAACLVLAAGIYWMAQAGDLEPPGPPAPTMKTLDQVEPRIPIHAADLPLTISSPGSYYLAENIMTTGDGITVEADDVTIDLMGFSLRGGTGDAIRATGRVNTIVKNGTIRDWDNSAVDLLATIDSQVLNLQVLGNGSGIRVESTSVVASCLVKDNTGVGIIAFGNGNRITDCEVLDNDADGIHLGTTTPRPADGNIISNNLIELNGAGIRVCCGSTDNRIEGNHVRGNTQQGIFIQGSSGNLVINNTASGNLLGDYSFFPGNDVGPIGSAATSTSPWANISF